MVELELENVDAESATENNEAFKGLLSRIFYSYFRLGLRTSDPLLNVVKWIAYTTEVEFSRF